MKVRSGAVAAAFLGVITMMVSAATAGEHRPEVNPLMKRFSDALVGRWDAKSVDDAGKPEQIVISYELTSGGTALVEKFSPGTAGEMMSVYHPDGESVLMTHYCMMGNQPRMRAEKMEGNAIHFELAGGSSNLRTGNEAHMRELTITMLDKDTVRHEWTLFEKGRRVGSKIFDLTRAQ